MFWNVVKWLLRVASIPAGVGLFFLALLAVVVVIECRDMTRDERPTRSDAELIEIFREHRVEFETLRRMFLQDSLDWIEPEGTALKASPGKLAAERLSRYDSLFARLELREGMRSCGEGCLMFGSTSSGKTLFANMDWKGYAFDSLKTCEGYHPSLDVLEREIRQSLETPESRQVRGGCRHIEGAWYLKLSF